MNTLSLKMVINIFITKEGSLEELINRMNDQKQIIEPMLQKEWSLQMLKGLNL